MVRNFDDLVYIKGSREYPWKHKVDVYYYLIDGLLIEAGPVSLAEQATHFFNTHEINQVVLTHLHPDHSGMAYWLQENKQVPIYVHSGSIEEANQEPELSPYRLNMWGRRRAFTPIPAPNIISTEKYTFDVIDTPGHCPQHITLFLKKKGWLFSGDLVCVAHPIAVFYDENLSDLILTIENILALPFKTVCCSHKGIIPNGKELFASKLNYLTKLQQKVRKLRDQGFTDRQIAHNLFPHTESISGLNDAGVSSYNLVSTL